MLYCKLQVQVQGNIFKVGLITNEDLSLTYYDSYNRKTDLSTNLLNALLLLLLLLLLVLYIYTSL